MKPSKASKGLAVKREGARRTQVFSKEMTLRCVGGLNHLFKREKVEEVNPNLEKQLRQGANVLGGRVPAPVLHKVEVSPNINVGEGGDRPFQVCELFLFNLEVDSVVEININHHKRFLCEIGRETEIQGPPEERGVEVNDRNIEMGEDIGGDHRW